MVDNTPANLQVLSTALNDKGYQVSVATSGRLLHQLFGNLHGVEGGAFE